MNISSNKAYRRNSEAILTIQILHEKIHPAPTWVPKSTQNLEKNLETLL